MSYDDLQAASPRVGLLFAAWADIDRVFSGLSDSDAVRQVLGSSSFAWTYAHMAQPIDSWINARFVGTERQPLIAEQRFSIGASGEAEDWEAIQTGVAEIRQTATDYLTGKSTAEIDSLTSVYDGSLEWLRGKSVPLRYFIDRAVVHIYFHIGEVAVKRESLGHSVGDYANVNRPYSTLATLSPSGTCATCAA